MLLNHTACALELFCFEQVMHGLLPSLALKKIVCVARMLCREPYAPKLRAQAAAQETFEERMQAILFAALVRCDRDEDVAAHERGQDRATVGVRVNAHTDSSLDAIKKRDAQQELLHVFRFVREDLFGEVVEDVSLRLS